MLSRVYITKSQIDDPSYNSSAQTKNNSKPYAKSFHVAASPSEILLQKSQLRLENERLAFYKKQLREDLNRYISKIANHKSANREYNSKTTIKDLLYNIDISAWAVTLPTRDLNSKETNKQKHIKYKNELLDAARNHLKFWGTSNSFSALTDPKEYREACDSLLKELPKRFPESY